MRFDVEVEQAHALAGERVNARRWRAAKNAAAIDAQLAIAEIVREDKNDVRLVRLLCCSEHVATVRHEPLSTQPIPLSPSAGSLDHRDSTTH